MIKRLNEFIKQQGISVRAFEQKISASDGMIRRAINNNTDIHCKWIANIADNYPQLNLEWLITGNGEMLKNATPENFNIRYFVDKIEELSKDNGKLEAENDDLKRQLKDVTAHKRAINLDDNKERRTQN
jgi:hypothetical protein